MNAFIPPISDEDLLLYDSEQDLILDLLPGNYIATQEQAKEIASAIIERINRRRKSLARSLVTPARPVSPA